jgi:hypothetical protein
VTRRSHLADDSIDAMAAQFAGTPAGLGMAPVLADGPGLEAGAQLSVSIGQLASQLQRQRADDSARRAERSHAIFPFDFNPQTIALTGGAGSLNTPTLYSPNEGYFWDVRKITASSFTSGTVALYKNAANDANAEVVFTAAGSYFFGSGQLILNSSDWLVFAASGVTGNVTISGRAISVRADYLADYLL